MKILTCKQKITQQVQHNNLQNTSKPDKLCLKVEDTSYKSQLQHANLETKLDHTTSYI